MTVKIDGKTINASVELEIHPVLSEFDEYTPEGYKKRIALFGAYRVWRINGVEDGSISWNDSIIKYLYDKSVACSKVTLTIDTSIYSFTGDVYIIDVRFTPEQNARLFTVTLQEAM